MPSLSGFRARRLLAPGALAGALVACAGPTDYKLTITTDVSCDDYTNTIVAIGSSAAEAQMVSPTIDTKKEDLSCDPALKEQTIGSVVFTPSGDDDKSFYVKIVTGIGVGADECHKPEGASGSGGLGGFANCIIKRRRYPFSPGKQLDVSVNMSLDCRGVPCNATTTCKAGKCVLVEDENVVVEVPNLGGGGGSSGAAGSAAGQGGQPQGGAGQGGAGMSGASGQGGASAGSGGVAGQAGASGAGQSGAAGIGGAGQAGAAGIGGAGQAGAAGIGGAGQAGAGQAGAAGSGAGQAGAAGNGGAGQAGAAGSGAAGEGGSGVAPPALRTPLAAHEYVSCAVIAPTELRCWGQSSPGLTGPQNLTIGDDEPAKAGSTFAFPSPVAQVAVGAVHACVLLDDHEVYCWGDYKTLGYSASCPADGILADNEPHDSCGPVPLGTLAPIKKLVAGKLQTCAVFEEGALRCWGLNDKGQLGVGTTTSLYLPASSAPETLAKASGVQDVALGRAHGCALLAGGNVRCWGVNDKGQLGLGHVDPVINAATGSNVPLGKTAVGVAAGYDVSCAILQDGDAACWGANDVGQLGCAFAGAMLGADATPGIGKCVVAFPSPIVELALAEQNVCARLANNDIRCWGVVDHGLLGPTPLDKVVGDDESANQQAAIFLGETRALRAGAKHMCALSVAGSLRCWGDNTLGPLGLGNPAEVSDPAAAPTVPFEGP